MQQVATFVVDLVDIGTMIEQLFDGRILASNQGILESKKTTIVHLIHICTKVEHLCRELEILLLIEIQEGSTALSIGEIDSHISLQEGLEHMIIALFQAIECSVAHQVEGSHFVVVWLIRIDSERENEVKERLLRVGNQEVDCVSESIGSEFSENFISIYLIIVLLSIVVIYLRGRLLITHLHSVSANFFSEFASAHCHSSVPYLSELFLSSADLLLLFFWLDICHYCIFALSKLKQL